MVQYAYFDSTAASPAPVLGWYDTIAFTYDSLPPSQNLLSITQDQWTAHFTAGSQWAVATGTLVAAAAPTDPVAQSQAALALQLAQGIAITSDGAPGVNATYALDATSTAQIFQIGLYASQFSIFPSGQAIQQYPDINGVFHSFTVPVFIAFLKAVAALTSALNMQQALMAQGGDPAWPPQIADII